MTERKTIVLYCEDDTMLTLTVDFGGVKAITLLSSEWTALCAALNALGLNCYCYRISGTPKITWTRQGKEVGKFGTGIELPLAIAFASLLSGRSIHAEYRDGEQAIPRGTVGFAGGVLHLAGYGTILDFLEDTETP